MTLEPLAGRHQPTYALNGLLGALGAPLDRCPERRKRDNERCANPP
jgi:hypothetical protein